MKRSKPIDQKYIDLLELEASDNEFLNNFFDWVVIYITKDERFYICQAETENRFTVILNKGELSRLNCITCDFPKHLFIDHIDALYDFFLKKYEELTTVVKINRD